MTALPLALAVLLAAWSLQAGVAAWMIAVTRHRCHKALRRTPATATDADAFTPTATVIVPIKGVDPGLDDTLDALFTQDYPDYALRFVVEDDADPAAAPIHAAMHRHPHRDATLTVAGPAPDHTGQKVHNQLAVLQPLSRASAGSGPPSGSEGAPAQGDAVAPDAPVLVFADADAAGDPTWLRHLVQPLRKPEVGCATGYRWLFPVPRADTGRVHPASRVASVLNSSVVSFMWNKRWHRPWGGSMALRHADCFPPAGPTLADAWRGTVSDDLSVHRFVRQRGLAVRYAPHCLLRSPCDYDWAGLWGFAVRQHTIVRVHEPGVFWAAFPWPFVYTLGLAAAVTALATGALHPAAPLAALAVVLGADQLRATTRAGLIADRFGDDAVNELRATLRIDRFATPLWLALHAATMARATTTRIIHWRGNRYRLAGPNDTQRLPG